MAHVCFETNGSENHFSVKSYSISIDTCVEENQSGKVGAKRLYNSGQYHRRSLEENVSEFDK